MLEILITSTFVDEPIKYSLLYWLHEAQFNCNVQFSPYNQLFQELTQPPQFNKKIDFNIVLIRFEDWGKWLSFSNENLTKLNENIKIFKEAIISAAQNTNTKFLIHVCPPKPSLSKKTLKAFSELENELKTSLEKIPSLYVSTSNEIDFYYSSQSKNNNYYDSYSDTMGHLPYNQIFYTLLGTWLARRICSLLRKPFKVIVLDCDNTLWEGVCAEAKSPSSIKISDQRKEMQSFFVKRSEAGILLCLASKNVEEDVNKVFEDHPDMVLKKTHITVAKINWNPKSQNIKALAKELNLGLDSFIFVDDNPVECAEVASTLPEVTVLQIPTAEEKFLEFIKNCWVFDLNKITNEDIMRNDFYKQDFRRQKFLHQTQNFKDFIEKLELKISITEATEDNISRIAQLSQRTNQFNTTTIRFSEEEISEFINKKTKNCLVVKVEDRFGDYGLVGLVIFSNKDQTLVIESFLLSCRVLGKGVEHYVLAWLGQIALKENLKVIRINFHSTSKNQPALNFLKKIIKDTSQDISFEFFIRTKEAIEIKFDPNHDIPEEIFQENVSPIEVKEAKSEKTSPTLVSFDKILIKKTISFYDINTLEDTIRAQLRKEREEMGLKANYKPHNNATEENLIKIWKTYLNVAEIGTDDAFISLGGSSLSAVRLIAEINNQFAIKLDVPDILKSTIAEIAQKISSYKTQDKMIISRKEADSFPLSFAQKRLLFLDKTLLVKATYNISVALSLDGFLNIEALEYAFNKVIEHQQELSISINDENSNPVQILNPNREFKLTHKKIVHHDEIPYEKELEIMREFNLENECLIRAKLLNITEKNNILIITMHHIVADESSIKILLKEISFFYNQFKNKLESPPIILSPKHFELSSLNSKKHNKKSSENYLSKTSHSFEDKHNLSIRYVDFANWNSTWIEIIKKEQLDFWLNHLENYSGIIDLPLNYPRPIAVSGKGACYTISIKNNDLTKLHKLGQKQQASLFTSLLNLFYILLYRFTGQQDLVVGIPVSHRHYPDVENLIGVFINTLPLRLQINKDITAADLLQNLSGIALEAYKNQDLPFELIVQNFVNEATLSYNPLVQVMFVLREEEFSIDLKEIKDCEEKLPITTSAFDLMLEVRKGSENADFNFIYSTDIFNEEFIESFALSFEELISNILEFSLETNIDKVNIIPTKDLAWMKNDWHLETKEIPESVIHVLFEQQAKNNPFKIALVDQHRSLTYRQLNHAANVLANDLLKTSDFNTETLVAICLESHFASIICILAVLKAGGAYVPLDYRHPNQLLEHIVEDSNALILFTEKKLITKFEKIPERKIKIIDNDKWTLLKENTPASNPSKNINASNLAYVLYTSGTTGKSKGVMIEHKSVCNTIKSIIEKVKIDSKDKVLQYTSLSFDVSVIDWATCFFAGATLYLIPNEDRLDPLKIIEFCNKNNITVAAIPPAMLSMFPECEIPSLKSLILAGETTPEKTIRKWQKKVPNLFNGYGPTETTILSTIHQYKENSLPNNIGRPLDHTLIFILDKNLQSVPVGRIGDLYIGGIGLARCYLNQPNMTNNKFIKIQHQNTSLLVYKTGDSVRYLKDASIEFIRRSEQLTKLNGHLINLHGIAHIISELPYVKNSVVLVKENKNTSSQIIAYVTFLLAPKSNTEYIHLIKNIRESLLNILPLYAIPSAIKVLEKIPLTVNGKINYSKLEEYEILLKVDKMQEQDSQLNLLETGLINILKALLPSPDIINNDDSFFAMGMDSISLIVFSRKIAQELKINIHVGSLYNNSTIAKLASYLQNSSDLLSHTLYDKCVLPICTQGKQQPLFLVHPVSGYATPYLKLSNYQFPRAIYGLSYPYFGEEDKQFSSIEEMAEYYLKTIETIQKDGAYYLGGWSFGGIVALEIARLLAQKQKTVGMVILIDSIQPKFTKFHSRQDSPNPDNLEIYKETNKNLNLLSKYVPKKYYGNTILLKACIEPIQFPLPNFLLNAWDNYLEPPPKVYGLNCSHMEIFSDANVPLIEKKLQLCLSKKISNSSLNLTKSPRPIDYLIFAVKNNDEALVDYILQKHSISGDDVDILGCNALYWAKFNSNEKIEKKLVDAGIYSVKIFSIEMNILNIAYADKKDGLNLASIVSHILKTFNYLALEDKKYKSEIGSVEFQWMTRVISQLNNINIPSLNSQQDAFFCFNKQREILNKHWDFFKNHSSEFVKWVKDLPSYNTWKSEFDKEINSGWGSSLMRLFNSPSEEKFMAAIEGKCKNEFLIYNDNNFTNHYLNSSSEYKINNTNIAVRIEYNFKDDPILEAQFYIYLLLKKFDVSTVKSLYYFLITELQVLLNLTPIASYFHDIRKNISKEKNLIASFIKDNWLEKSKSSPFGLYSCVWPSKTTYSILKSLNIRDLCKVELGLNKQIKLPLLLQLEDKSDLRNSPGQTKYATFFLKNKDNKNYNLLPKSKIISSLLEKEFIQEINNETKLKVDTNYHGQENNILYAIVQGLKDINIDILAEDKSFDYSNQSNFPKKSNQLDLEAEICKKASKSLNKNIKFYITDMNQKGQKSYRLIDNKGLTIVQQIQTEYQDQLTVNILRCKNHYIPLLKHKPLATENYKAKAAI